mmetsp:Transcript_10329/g.15835  ORF Transcript_10329/g.15835 Transcript_10329/m.15835 type:complete len:326 (+) Transcript_10329:321-1298(+)
MRLLDLLIVGRSPIPDAVQAEHVGAVLEDSKLLSAGEYHVQTDYASPVVLNLLLLLGSIRVISRVRVFEVIDHRPHRLRVLVATAGAEPAIALEEELAYFPVLVVVLHEIVDDLIVIVQGSGLWHVLWLLLTVLSSTNLDDLANLLGVEALREEDSFLLNAFLEEIVKLDYIGVVTLTSLLVVGIEHPEEFVIAHLGLTSDLSADLSRGQLRSEVLDRILLAVIKMRRMLRLRDQLIQELPKLGSILLNLGGHLVLIEQVLGAIIEVILLIVLSLVIIFYLVYLVIVILVLVGDCLLGLFLHAQLLKGLEAVGEFVLDWLPLDSR